MTYNHDMDSEALHLFTETARKISEGVDVGLDDAVGVCIDALLCGVSKRSVVEVLQGALSQHNDRLDDMTERMMRHEDEL